MILRYLLLGAFHPDSQPLEPGRLDIAVRLALVTLRLSPFRMGLTGTVDVERIAARARATGELRIVPPNVQYRFDFVTDEGRAVSLVFSQSLARITIRSLTELSGHLVASDDGTVLGRVRVRFDVRGALGI